MAHGQGQTSNRTGGYGAGGKRGHGKDKAVRKAEKRERDPRWQSAMNSVKAAQQELDELIEHQKNEPATGEAWGAVYARELAEKRARLHGAEMAQKRIESEIEVVEEVELPTLNRKPAFSVKRLPQTGDGNFQFSETTARLMLKAGYNIKYVIEFTGVGYLDLQDFPLDAEGYGWPDRDKEEEEDDECA